MVSALPRLAVADGGGLDLTPPPTVPLDVWLDDVGSLQEDWREKDLAVFVDDEPTLVVPNSLVSAGSLPGRFLIFVDDVFCMPAPRNRFIDRLREQLDDLGPDDMMAIVAYDGQRLSVLTPWTRSVPRLSAGLQHARDRPALGPRRLAEQRQLAATHRGALRPGRTSSFSGIGFNGAQASQALGAAGLQHARTVTEQVADVMQAAAAAVEQLGADAADLDNQATASQATPARATLLLLAGAWPVSSNALILTWSRDGGPIAGEAAAQQVLAPLVAAADRWGFVVSPVTVPIWGTGGRVEKRQSRRSMNVLMAATLDELAIATGGTSWLDGVHADLLRRSIGAARRGYRLAIRPGWRGSDQRAELRVTVAGESAGLRTRTGLADPAQDTRVGREAAAALMLGSGLPGAERLTVEVEPQGRGVLRMTIRAFEGLEPLGPGLVWSVVDPAAPAGGAVLVAMEDTTVRPTSNPPGLSYVLDIRSRPRGNQLVLAVLDPKTDRLWLKDVLVPKR